VILQTLHTPDERRSLPGAPALPPFDAAQLSDHLPDLHLCAVSGAGAVEAHASLWWTNVPPYAVHTLGVIGHYASVSDEAAAFLLPAALRILDKHACTLAVGPMDGNTWRRYRFVVDAGSEPPFFLEPANPAAWPLQWQRAGFAPLAHYFSTLNADLTQTDARVSRVSERMDRLGVHIRAARPPDLPSDLVRIYRLSQIAFAHNFLYTELPQSAYLAQYEKILPHIQPELFLLAERGGDLVGFVFAIPDLAQAARGLSIDTFLLKTVAILPDPALAGLGALMAARVQQEGHRLGFRRCIHALMYEKNVSLNTSLRYGSVMRRYALFSQELPR
jgi:GNAT superfamily N-acetyltransferase